MPTDPEIAGAAGTDAWRLLPLEKQQRVYDAAVAEFASRGYTAASMNALVRSAGISKGSLFHYFRTKAALFDGIVGVAFDLAKGVLKAEREASRGLPLPERLVRLLEAGYRFIDEHPHLARIYFHVLQSGDAPFGRARLAALRRQSRSFLQKLVEEAQAAGEIDPAIDAARAAWLLDAMFERLLGARDDAPERAAWLAALRQLVEGGLAPAARKGNHG